MNDIVKGRSLDAESRCALELKQDATVVVDRGMAFDSNLAEIKARKLHYIVASRQPERDRWLARVRGHRRLHAGASSPRFAAAAAAPPAAGAGARRRDFVASS